MTCHHMATCICAMWCTPVHVQAHVCTRVCVCVRVGFNGSGPVRFLAQYSVQTLIRSQSRSTSVTVRFGLNFGLKFSNVKNFQISKTSFKCQKFSHLEV